MSKVRLEWIESAGWRFVMLEEKTSQRGNLYVKHNDQVYVYKNHLQGTPVISNVGVNKWEIVGRIDSGGTIFLGQRGEQSYRESMDKQAKNKTTFHLPIIA